MATVLCCALRQRDIGGSLHLTRVDSWLYEYKRVLKLFENNLK